MAPFMNAAFRPEVVHLSKSELHIKIPSNKVLIGNPSVPCYHGGVVASAIDHAGGFCIWASLDDPHLRCSTVDLRIDYLHPALLEDMYVLAKLEHKTNKLARADVVVYDAQQQKKIAMGRTLFNIYRVNDNINESLRKGVNLNLKSKDTISHSGKETE